MSLPLVTGIRCDFPQFRTSSPHVGFVLQTSASDRNIVKIFGALRALNLFHIPCITIRFVVCTMLLLYLWFRFHGFHLVVCSGGPAHQCHTRLGLGHAADDTGSRGTWRTTTATSAVDREALPTRTFAILSLVPVHGINVAAHFFCIVCVCIYAALLYMQRTQLKRARILRPVFFILFCSRTPACNFSSTLWPIRF